MNQYKTWKNSLTEPRQMLVDLMVNGIVIALIYAAFLKWVDKESFNIKRVVFAGLFGTLLLTRSLKWRHVKSLFARKVHS